MLVAAFQVGGSALQVISLRVAWMSYAIHLVFDCRQGVVTGLASHAVHLLSVECCCMSGLLTWICKCGQGFELLVDKLFEQDVAPSALRQHFVHDVGLKVHPFASKGPHWPSWTRAWGGGWAWGA